jgi:hypothetical protein
VKDFKPTKSVALLGDFTYTQVGPDGELKHATDHATRPSPTRPAPTAASTR